MKATTSITAGELVGDLRKALTHIELSIMAFGIVLLL